MMIVRGILATFFVYILKSKANGRFYVGHSDDIQQRLNEHNSNRSHYTRGKGPWELVHIEEFRTRSLAMKREYEIKARKSKKYLEKLTEIIA